MRIWDLSVKNLCREHLLGEHRELHAIWKIITNNKKGYSNHPETKRWKGKLLALYKRHDQEIAEMEKRGYNHLSPLDKSLAMDTKKQTSLVNTTEEQRGILKAKKCQCKI